MDLPWIWFLYQFDGIELFSFELAFLRYISFFPVGANYKNIFNEIIRLIVYNYIII